MLVLRTELRSFARGTEHLASQPSHQHLKHLKTESFGLILNFLYPIVRTLRSVHFMSGCMLSVFMGGIIGFLHSSQQTSQVVISIFT